MHPLYDITAFAGQTLDRAGHLRSDPAWMEQQLAEKNAVLLPFAQGKTLFHPDPDRGPLWIPLHTLPKPLPEPWVFLGIDRKGNPRFAAETPTHDCLQLGTLVELRDMLPRNTLTRGEMSILAHARALLGWRTSHTHCTNCGTPTLPSEGGCKLVCPACHAQAFPRTDPVVIMLPVHEDHAFLARQANWPPNRFSAPAGFIESGETMEDAVARELTEEANIRTHSVRYIASQPWPWPFSLMLGCFAFTHDRSFHIDGVELETGDWFSKKQLTAMMNDNASPALPPPTALAHTLVKAFLSPQAPAEPPHTTLKPATKP